MAVSYWRARADRAGAISSLSCMPTKKTARGNSCSLITLTWTTILVEPRQEVRRGEQIATVGTANGKYWAHLHFEMREFTTPFIGPGYRDDTRGWIDPSAFIASHRGAPEDDIGQWCHKIVGPRSNEGSIACSARLAAKGSPRGETVSFSPIDQPGRDSEITINPFSPGYCQRGPRSSGKDLSAVISFSFSAVSRVVPCNLRDQFIGRLSIIL